MDDYNVCPVTEDGKHVPVTGYDPETPKDFAAIACSACGLGTSIPIPPVDEIEWN